jgi:ficolin
LDLSRSLGSFADKIADKHDELAEAGKEILGIGTDLEEPAEEEVSEDEVEVDKNDNEVIQEQEEEEEEEVAEPEEADSNDPKKATEETETVDILTRLKRLEYHIKDAKRITRNSMRATKNLIRLINETKSESCCCDKEAGEVTNLPRSCYELMQQGQTESGVYTIGVVTSFLAEPKPMQVYCDMETDGGGWLVFQRRKDGAQDFYLGWNQYAMGFGDLNADFWLGNNALHILTSVSANEMRVDMTDGDGVSKYAKYSTFRVGSQSAQFELNVGGYSGDAGDSMTYHNGRKFSTLDQDNDIYGSSCATAYKGGWWYGKCHVANLNGLYLNGAHSTYADGVEWHSWHGYHYSIQFTEMKIRPLV